MFENLLISHCSCETKEHIVQWQILFHNYRKNPKSFLFFDNLNKPSNNIIHALNVALYWISSNKGCQNSFDFVLSLFLLEEWLLRESSIQIFLNREVVWMRPIRVGFITVFLAYCLVVAITIVFKIAVGSRNSKPILSSELLWYTFDNILFEIHSISILNIILVLFQVSIQINIILRWYKVSSSNWSSLTYCYRRWHSLINDLGECRLIVIKSIVLRYWRFTS